MTQSFWSEDKYQIHFYCALCGGPFARVEIAKPGDPENTLLTQEEINETYAKSNPLEYEFSQATTSHPPRIQARRAYDGRKIDFDSLKWTRTARALIHENAISQPIHAVEELVDGSYTYLSGRAKIREDGSWADAYTSIYNEPRFGEEDEFGLPHYAPDCGFHLYQEPDRQDRQLHISSIPFHDECWNVLNDAYDAVRAYKGFDQEEEPRLKKEIDLDLLWDCLRENLPIDSIGSISDLSIASIRTGSASNVATRLSKHNMGNGGYLEAEKSGAGRQWLHLDKHEWLVQNPSNVGLLSRTMLLPPDGISCLRVGSTPPVARSKITKRTDDPFWGLPHEVLLEMAKYLTVGEIFNWRRVSVPANLLALPQREFRRFILEDMEYFLELVQQIKSVERSEEDFIDWEHIFNKACRAHVTDDGLRNRRRIWKISRPLAEEVFERSNEHISRNFEEGDILNRHTISVVRGKVGVRSGTEGCLHSILFSVPVESWDPFDSSMTNTKARLDFCESITVWLHPLYKSICGFEMNFRLSSSDLAGGDTIKRRIGQRSVLYETFRVPQPDDQRFTGILAYQKSGFISGIAFTFQDGTSIAEELNSNEITTPYYGVWNGGGVRRLVAPPKYRLAAGITAFVNRAGFIETLALFEQTTLTVLEDGDDFLIPPSTIPLTHEQASLWKDEVPPEIEILDRVGPFVQSWRTRPAELAIFDSMDQALNVGHLFKISSFHNGNYLSGVLFHYRDIVGGRPRYSSKGIGNTNGPHSAFWEIPLNRKVSAMVIGYSHHGLHSLQIIDSRGDGPIFGNRYLGHHKVFASLDDVGSRQKSPVPFQALRTPIIGLHGLYAPELDRLVQLGIAVQHRKAWKSTNRHTIERYPTSQSTDYPVPLEIPFTEADEFQLPWVDYAPPSDYERGSKNSESSAWQGSFSEAKFSGWVSFADPVSKITIYGNMEGIRFEYQNSRVDSVFGNTSTRLEEDTQRFSYTDGRIIGIASLDPSPTAFHRQNSALPFIKFFDQRSQGSFLPRHIEAESPSLVGIKFSFTFNSLSAWYPLVRATKLPKINLRSRLCGSIPDIGSLEMSPCTQNVYRIFAGSFVRNGQNTPAIGIRGYQDNGDFCGVRICRGNGWDEDVIGRATAFSKDFFLQGGEVFVGTVYCNRSLRLKTSTGRVSPWIGISPWIGSTESGPPRPYRPPARRKVVGIYIAYGDPFIISHVGLLHATEHDVKIYDAHQSTEQPEDSVIPLPAGFTLSPVDLNMQHFRDLNFDQSINPSPKKACTIVFPRYLTKIEAYVNSVPGRFGLKALRFSGQRQMGEIILGEWQDQFADPTAEEQMAIDGPHAERITDIEVGIFRHSQGDRIVSLQISTNREQKVDLVSWRRTSAEKPPESQYEEYSTSASENQNAHALGFGYLLGLYIHDLQLVEPS